MLNILWSSLCKVWQTSKGGSSQYYHRKGGGRASQCGYGRWVLKDKKIKVLWKKGIVGQGERLCTSTESKNLHILDICIQDGWDLKCKGIIAKYKANRSWNTGPHMPCSGLWTFPVGCVVNMLNLIPLTLNFGNNGETWLTQETTWDKIIRMLLQ